MRELHIGMLLALLFSTEALAARNEEFIRYPSLLMFGETTQSLGVSYSLAYHTTANSSSSTNSLRERYNLNTTAAILDPHLVSLQLIAGLSYSQQFGNPNTTTLLDGEYNLSASCFDLSYHPVSFASSRMTSVINNGFTPSYSLTTQSNQVSATLLNIKVPAQIFYVHTTTDTSGLPVNSSSTSDAAGLALHHSIPELSTTSLAISTNRSDTANSSNVSYSLGASNFLTLDKKQRYRLSTSVSLNDTKSAGVPQHDLAVAAELNCGFGQALSASFSDRYSANSTRSFEDTAQSTNSNTFSASLSHRLYQSLLTNLSVSASQGTSLGGDTSNYTGSAHFTYTKLLPAQSNLTLSAETSYGYSSQNLAQATFAVRNELHQGVNPGDFVPIAQAGRIQAGSVVTVTNNDPNVPQTYIEDTDYTVDPLGRGITILTTSPNIPPGSDILITYTDEVDPSLTYRTQSVGTSGFLSLLGGRYAVSGSIANQSQERVSGTASNAGLVDSTIMNLTGTVNYDPTQFGAEFRRVDSSQERSTQFGAFLTHSLRTSANGMLSATVRDTYTMSDGVGTGVSQNQNALSLSAAYSRVLFNWITMNSSVTFNDTRSGSAYSDFLALRATLSGGYNLLQFSVSAQTLLRISRSTTVSDTNFSCSVTRFF